MKLKAKELLDKSITRAASLASIDAALHRRTISGSIFLACEETSPNLVIPGKLLTPLELIEGEREVLGVYLSAHPLDFVKRDLLPNSKLERLKNGQYVGVKGIYRKLKIFTTKKRQEAMAVAHLETRTQNVKTLFWPKIWEKVGNLVLDKPVWIMGKIILEEQEDILALPVFSIEVEDLEYLT